MCTASIDNATAAGRATMRAARVVEPGRVEIDRVAVPEPGDGQMRVHLEGCGVCASNVPPFEGRPWFTYPFSPGALGHEGWGHVDALGPNVTHVREGERIAFISDHAYAEYDLVDARSVIALPPALDDQPMPGEPLGCAFNIYHRAAIDPGQSVAIVGVGFLGALLTQLTQQGGANVIAISRRPFALNVAQRMGARHTLSLDDRHQVVAQVEQATEGRMCDTVIECTGKQGPLDLAGALARVRGRLVVAGYHQDGPRQVDMQLWNWRGLDVINAHERDPRVYLDGMRHAVDTLSVGQLDPQPLFTHTYGLERLGEALEITRDRPAGFMKALIDMGR